VSVFSAVVSFAAVAGLLTVIPGLDTALVLRSAIAHGRRQAFATAVGIGTGALIWGAGAAAGVSALLTASTTAYSWLKVVGAGYLVWLGVRLVVAALRSPAAADEVVQVATVERAWRGWRRGLLTNLVNPKIGAFYVAVLPQFIPAGTSPLMMGLLLAIVHDLEGMLWFTLLILGATKARALLRRRSTGRTIDGVTGGVLIGFGIKLGLSR